MPMSWMNSSILKWFVSYFIACKSSFHIISSIDGVLKSGGGGGEGDGDGDDDDYVW